MKIRYMINSDGSTYVEYDINLTTKHVHFKLVEAGIQTLTDSKDISSVLNIEPSFNPHVQLAKKGLLWDFHIFKQDAYGKEHRAILSSTTPTEFIPIHVELINDGTKDLILKNYSIHLLENYNSGVATPENVSNFTTTLDDTGVMIEWNNPSYEGFTGINLYRTNTFTNERVELITLSHTTTSFYDTPLPAVGNYYYEARTFNALNVESSGVGGTENIAPKWLEVSSLTDVSFMVNVKPETEVFTISVNPTWTFSRKSIASNKFSVRYVNAKTGEDLMLPDGELVDGELLFKNETFTIGSEETYEFTVKQLDSLGAVIDTDTVNVLLTSETSGIDRTKVTGLTFDSVTGYIVFNPIHLADTSIKYYHLYINSQFVKRFAITDLAKNGTEIRLYKLMDFSSENVIGLAVSKDGTAVFGEAEVGYIPFDYYRAVASWKDPYPELKAADNRTLKGVFSTNEETLYVYVENTEKKYGLNPGEYDFSITANPFGSNIKLSADVIRQDDNTVTFILKSSELITKGIAAGVVNFKIDATKSSIAQKAHPHFSVISNIRWDGTQIEVQNSTPLNK